MSIACRSTFLMAILAIALVGTRASAQLIVVADPVSQGVFGAGLRKIPVLISNRSDKAITVQAHVALAQTGADVAIRLTNTSWKQLQLLPGQTVLENASIDFPEVNAKCLFVIQWIVDTNKVIGITAVNVYPQKLLSPLKAMVGDSPIGIVDPGNQVKPLLEGLKLEVLELQNTGFEDFPGKLAIVASIQNKDQQVERLGEKIKALSKRGVAVVWIQSTSKNRTNPVPSFFSVLQNSGAVVICTARVIPESFGEPGVAIEPGPFLPNGFVP